MGEKRQGNDDVVRGRKNTEMNTLHVNPLAQSSDSKSMIDKQIIEDVYEEEVMRAFHALNIRMEKIPSYWQQQLESMEFSSTVNTMESSQDNLDTNLLDQEEQRGFKAKLTNRIS